MIKIRLNTLAVTVLWLAFIPASASAAAATCVPHLDAQGPTVYVAPNYGHPLQSDYSYDASGTHVGVVTCL
jgi:hypothetical protein